MSYGGSNNENFPSTNDGFSSTGNTERRNNSNLESSYDTNTATGSMGDVTRNADSGIDSGFGSSGRQESFGTGASGLHQSRDTVGDVLRENIGERRQESFGTGASGLHQPRDTVGDALRENIGERRQESFGTGGQETFGTGALGRQESSGIGRQESSGLGRQEPSGFGLQESRDNVGDSLRESTTGRSERQEPFGTESRESFGTRGVEREGSLGTGHQDSFGTSGTGTKRYTENLGDQPGMTNNSSSYDRENPTQTSGSEFFEGGSGVGQHSTSDINKKSTSSYGNLGDTDTTMSGKDSSYEGMGSRGYDEDRSSRKPTEGTGVTSHEHAESTGDSKVGKLMEKAGGMMRNEKLERKGLEKREEKGHSGEGSY